VEEVAAIFPLVHLLQPYMVDSAVFEKKEQLIFRTMLATTIHLN
jgi:hypothetical protein